ncbi:MAG TPA: hypothetical protein VHM91_00310 [Verrucomicrobiales bacterium]|nr:hypothetical protein [Verrucomicrobiales bacterium]
MRLDIIDNEVKLGSTPLPSDPEGLSDYLASLSPASKTKLRIDFVFAPRTPVTRINDMVRAGAEFAGHSEDQHFYFNIAGRDRKAFSLDLRDGSCCGPRDFVTSDDLLEAPFPPGLREQWIKVELCFQEDTCSIHGESMDGDELRTHLESLRPLAAGVFVEITVPGSKNFADLLPVLEICQITGVEINLSLEPADESYPLSRPRSRLPAEFIPVIVHR